MKRLCIYPADVVLLTGKSDSYARRLIRVIKKDKGKNKKQLLTIREFCDYMHLDVKEVTDEINNAKIEK
uniref:hypothetical protein n=1 Tax=Gelidibacter sp. TaxID=2018083 RepID=UPI00404982CE